MSFLHLSYIKCLLSTIIFFIFTTLVILLCVNDKSWRNLLAITDIELRKGDMDISVDENENSLFQYTCKSFDVLCQVLQLNAIRNISHFNAKCKFLSTYLLGTMFDISPLFMLSLRREYLMMTMSNEDNCNLNYDLCHQILINDIFKVLHQTNNFHQTPHKILFHSHISKCLGTTFFRGLQQIASQFNKTNGIRRDLYWKTQTFVFKGVSASNIKPYASCEWLYDYHTNITNNAIINIPLRVESEAPLTRLCPQYYNSIILRHPIQHRLSFLAYFNRFWANKAGLYCKHSREWKLCRDTQEMDGFIFELFGARNQSHSETATLQTLGNQHLIIEYINNLVQNRSIGYRQLAIINKQIRRSKSGLSPLFYRFDSKQLVGWMSNIYNRWIGYNQNENHQNNLLDSINANVSDIMKSAKQILFDSKRILLQYDYVLPIDDSENMSTDSDIWRHSTRHILRHILNITESEYAQIAHTNPWPHNRSQRKFAGITTSKLLDYFNKSEELNLLIQYNMLDIALFDFSKLIAKADLHFFRLIN